jgi:hypothetical protein
MDNWHVNVIFDGTDHSFSFQGNCTPDGFMYAMSGVQSSYLVTLSTVNSSQYAVLTGINVQGPITVLNKSYTCMGRSWPCYLLIYDGTVQPAPVPPACFSLTFTFMGLQMVVPDPTIIGVEPPN